MYRHEDPLKRDTDWGIWIGGIVTLALVVGIIAYGVMYGDKTTADRPALTTTANR